MALNLIHLSQFCFQILSNLWMSFRHFNSWDIPTDPFASSWAQFVVIFYQTSECNLDTLVLGAFNLIHLQLLEPTLFSIFLKLLNVIQAFKSLVYCMQWLLHKLSAATHWFLLLNKLYFPFIHLGSCSFSVSLHFLSHNLYLVAPVSLLALTFVHFHHGNMPIHYW